MTEDSTTEERTTSHTPGPAGRATPGLVADLAEGCVRFVERAVGVRLDYTPETLSLLDHYVTSAAEEARQRPEALNLVARSVAAYLGEVIRRRYGGWWHDEGDDVAAWTLRFEPVFMTLSPFALACVALGMSEEEAGLEAGLVIEAEELDEIGSHLAMLPPVPEDEFNLPSTRFDVIHIVIDQLKARAHKRGLGDVSFDDADYGD
jgi:hypothetical protein